MGYFGVAVLFVIGAFGFPFALIENREDDKLGLKEALWLTYFVLAFLLLLVATGIFLFKDFEKETIKVKEVELERHAKEGFYIQIVDGDKVVYTEKSLKGSQIKSVKQEDVYIKYEGNEAIVEEYDLNVSAFVKFMYTSSLNKKEYIITLPESEQR